MSNTTHAKRVSPFALAVIATMPSACGISGRFGCCRKENTTMSAEQALSRKQQSIAPIAAAMALGDMSRLDAALNRGLDAGLTVSEAKEILVQLYAYTGFPRSLNALGELMKVLDARKQRGIHDPAGREPTPIPAGSELLTLGTANQTKLLGRAGQGPCCSNSPPRSTTS